LTALVFGNLLGLGQLRRFDLPPDNTIGAVRTADNCHFCACSKLVCDWRFEARPLAYMDWAGYRQDCLVVLVQKGEHRIAASSTFLCIIL
jgi:hypothetical protein